MYPVRVPRTSACFSIVIFATQCLRSSSPSCQQARSARLSHACLKTCPSKTVFVYSPLTRVNMSNSHDTFRYSVTSLNGTVFVYSPLTRVNLLNSHDTSRYSVTSLNETVFVYSPLTRVNLSNSHDTTRYSVTSLNGTVFPAMQAPPHSPDYDTGRDLPATINALLTALKQKGEPPLAYVGWLTVTDMLASVTNLPATHTSLHR
jgi:hypothetical protein